MSHVITDRCIGVKEAACVTACPVDCIHPRKDEPEFGQVSMLHIHPEQCIDCGACRSVCVAGAIYESLEATPWHQKDLIAANAVYRNGDVKTMVKAEAIVLRHIIVCG